jgi:mRNA interferase RelE/StbE
MHNIEVSPAAERDLHKLKDRIRKEDFELILSVISGLQLEPRPPGVRKIKGEEKVYRVRAGRYRVIYEIYDDIRLVVLLTISRRTETTYR